MQPEKRSLLDRIKPEPKPEPRVPVWIARMKERGLPAKDMTRTAA